MNVKLTLQIILLCILCACDTKSQNEPPEDDLAGVFEERNADQLTHVAHIASASEPGERIRITGTVYMSDGKTPAAGVLMYFYHTNAKGIYAKHGTEDRSSLAWWHGYNRGWLKTNAHGKYEINTIKPAPYPALIEPAHIHAGVKAAFQKKAYDLGAITFKGDPLATPEYWYNVEQHGHPRDGGTGLKRNQQGILEGTRDFILYAQYDLSSNNSGLNVGENCPTFTPIHASGKDKGTKVCPMCKYGYKQGVMAWVNTNDWSAMQKLAVKLNKLAIKRGAGQFHAFLIFMNPENLPVSEVNDRLHSMAISYGIKNVALLHIAPEKSSKTFDLYRLNRHKDISNTILLFKGRYISDKYINGLPDL
jgi:protocatechuate 3,4-dioxygenase beta subunit